MVPELSLTYSSCQFGHGGLCPDREKLEGGERTAGKDCLDLADGGPHVVEPVGEESSLVDRRDADAREEGET